MKTRRRLFLILALVALLAAAGCAPRAEVREEMTQEMPTAMPSVEPEELALRAAQIFLEAQLGRPLGELAVAYGAAEWPDAGLGCPPAGAQFPAAPTPGFQFDVTVDGVLYELHTNVDGSQVVLCPSPQLEVLAGRPDPAVLEAARAVLAMAVLQNPSDLGEPLVIEAARWTDVALNCPAAGETPAPADIEGYALTFLHDDRLYELRTSANGELAVVCFGSGALGPGPTAVPAPPSPDEPALEAARAWLAGQIGVPAESLALKDGAWQQVTFPSAALGCPQPDMAYADVLTDGYSFVLVYEDSAYELHTNLAGSVVVQCGEPQANSKLVDDLAAAGAAPEWSWFANDVLDLGMSFPAGWWVQADPGRREAIFNPGKTQPTLGMSVRRVDMSANDAAGWLEQAQVELLAADATTLLQGGRQLISGVAPSQCYELLRAGERVVERVTVYPAGYLVRQWAPAGEWAAWNETFLRMLASMQIP